LSNGVSSVPPLSPAPPLEALCEQARSTFKPRDVEELIDYWVNRPAASVLVQGFARLPITPNQVTVLSGLVGLSAGFMIADAPLDRASWQLPLAAVALFLSVLLDCADGQLARLRRQSSMVGRALDGYVDVIPTASVFLGSAWLLYRAGYHPLYINALGWSAGYSMKWQVHSYDHAKNIYLGNVLGPDAHSNPLPTQKDIEDERQARLREGDRLGALILRGFAHLTGSQRRGWQKARMGLGRAGARTDAERAEYRSRFVGNMRLWTFNGLASHLAVLLTAIAATRSYMGATLAAWWFILVPMNLFTLYLGIRDRRIEREVQAKLGVTGDSLTADCSSHQSPS
jgi:hypothetical protein